MKRSRHNACGYTLLLTAVAVVLAMFFIFLILPGLTGLRCAKYAAVTGHPAEQTGVICRRTDTGEFINTFNNKEISHEKTHP
ncbi:hypothetical protein NYO97_04355 [Morganella morganii]|uniref:hypothetical protein n=1 Tax=Morganella morganii TaxID=582 RepID=UPI0006621D77|nr:hypothetical protein [Morganella morganii]SGD15348.1 Uncharacterised protein [Mycobacterium tuberculosis]MBA5838684.1 hypothetical protein [Morganella morganii]MBT0406244.1 hypothetical protein [Morganella morganii subsp. morganii]MBT0413654.1 hypothetical protein [Morganella morganii subsp. morganii]MBT0511246.1 hypothetical protein [Morganella morganii subsp. morganii]